MDINASGLGGQFPSLDQPVLANGSPPPGNMAAILQAIKQGSMQNQMAQGMGSQAPIGGLMAQQPTVGSSVASPPMMPSGPMAGSPPPSMTPPPPPTDPSKMAGGLGTPVATQPMMPAAPAPVPGTNVPGINSGMSGMFNPNTPAFQNMRGVPQMGMDPVSNALMSPIPGS
jgi:hypothetical protein